MYRVCKHATQVLQGATDIKNALNVNSIYVVTDWQERLQVCKSVTKPDIMKGLLAKCTCDISLSVNDSTDYWDLTLVNRNYKFKVGLEESRKVIAQLAGYSGELFDV